jgi:hypothetical protein
MSKLIYFKRYLNVIDRLRSRPCSFSELQDHVMHKLQQDVIRLLNMPYVLLNAMKKDISTPLESLFNTTAKTKTYTIDEEIETNR